MNINIRSQPFRNPLCVALDLDDLNQVEALVEQLEDTVGGFKIGPRLLMKYGPELIKKLCQRLPVFVDCKFFDIPSTMEASVKAAFDFGASLVTVHGLSGVKALSKLAEIQSSYKSCKVLCVTVLTSWDGVEVQKLFRARSAQDLVLDICKDVQLSGLNSIVCSAQELQIVKPFGFYSVTPGIRFDLQDAGDQSRTVTPMAAIKEGAAVLVVGRPIIQAPSPREAALDFMTAIYENKI